MPVVELATGARIAYEEHGDPAGSPVLLIAPGGLRSTASRWAPQPWNPLVRLPAHRVIAMDQRNAGGSSGPIAAGAGWHTYTADQLALLDHLGVGGCHVIGMCIGGPYIMGLIEAAPERVRSAVMLQPIGLDANRHAFVELLDSWRAEIGGDHPEADDAVWLSFGHAMFGGDFMFNATREQAACCQVPVLLARGDDLYHPASISDELATLLPDVVYVRDWKSPEHLPALHAAIERFLAEHSSLRSAPLEA